MLEYFCKQSRESLDYTIDFSRFLVGREYINLSSAVITAPVVNDAAATLVITRVGYTKNQVAIWLAGGEDGVQYTVTVTIGTDQGRQKEQQFLVKTAGAGVAVPIVDIADTTATIGYQQNALPMGAGASLSRFTVTLSTESVEPVSIDWSTSDGTAQADIDYPLTTGTVIFAPGETSKTLDVFVYGRTVGNEDRSFFVELMPPANAILGDAQGECVIQVNTSGTLPVTQLIVPTGPRGYDGKSAYQVWLDLGNTGTEQHFIDSLSPSAEEIAEEVAPLLDVGNSPVTAEDTETLDKPDEMTVKRLARRVAYVGAAKVATVVLSDGDNLLEQSDLTGDTVDFGSAGLYPRIMRGSIIIDPVWSVEQDGRLLIKAAEAGDALYVCEYDLISSNRLPTYGDPVLDLPSFDEVPSSSNDSKAQFLDVQVQALANRSLAMLRRHAEDMAASIGLTLAPGSFEKGSTVTSADHVLLQERTGFILSWGGALNKTVPEKSTPASTGGMGVELWTDRTTDKAFKATGANAPSTPQDRARRNLSTQDFYPATGDLGAAVNAVRASLETEYSPSALVGVRGGDCFLPRGTHSSITPIDLERHSSGTTAFSPRGQGQSTTQLDMTGAPAFTDGITGGVDGATFGKLCDFGIKKAPRNGLRLEKYSRMTFESLEMRESGADGFYFGNGFVAVVEKLTATGNAGAGFNFAVTQQHTSHTINGGYAFQNAGPGWILGNMNYSATNGQASDNNGNFGYLIAKCNGFVMNGPGAESNARSAFGVLANSTSGSTRNTVIDGAFAYHNDLAGEGYGNLLYVSAADGETADVLISNSESIPNVGSTVKDIIVTGVGATATIYNCTMPNGWESRSGGYIHWVHKTLLVKNLTVPVAPTATPVCNLRSSQGHAIRYAGEITVLASNAQPSTGERNIAIYKLLVCKSIAGGAQVTELAKLGHTTGAAASSPAFTWTMASDRLVATPLGAAGGIPFWFEIDTSSQIVATPI